MCLIDYVTNCDVTSDRYMLLLPVIRAFDRISSWWRHQMETFAAFLSICAGNSLDNDVIMSAMASQITSRLFTQAFIRRRSTKTSKLRVTGFCVRGIHQWPVNSPHQAPITRKMFPFDDVIMEIKFTPNLQGLVNLYIRLFRVKELRVSLISHSIISILSSMQ